MATPKRAASVLTWSRMFAVSGGALVAHDLGLVGEAEHAAHRGIQHRGELVVGAGDAADGLVEFERVDDAVAHEGVHLQPLVVGGENFLLRRFQIENAVVDIDHRFHEGQLEMQTRFSDEAALRHRLAEPQQQRLFGLVDLEGRGRARG